MSTRQPSLEETPAAATTDLPHVDAEPGDLDKSGTPSTSTQDRAANPNNPPPQDPDAEPSITDTLLGTSTTQPPPADEPSTSTTSAADATQTGDEPPTQDQDRKPENQPQDQDRKIEDTDEPQSLTPEQERVTPKFARKRIKNLERDLETASAAVHEMERRAAGVGFESSDEILESIDLQGRAFKRRDPAALAELDRRLVAAGHVRSTPAPGIDLDALETAIRDGEYETADKLIAAAKSAAKQQPSAPQPDTPSPPGDQRQAEQAAAQAKAKDVLRMQVARAQGEVQAVYDDLRAAHGDKADDLIAQIRAEVTRRDKAAQEEYGSGFRPERVGKVVRDVRDMVVAKMRDLSQRRAPAQLRTSSPARQHMQPSTLTDELLADG